MAGTQTGDRGRSQRCGGHQSEDESDRDRSRGSCSRSRSPPRARSRPAVLSIEDHVHEKAREVLGDQRCRGARYRDKCSVGSTFTVSSKCSREVMSSHFTKDDRSSFTCPCCLHSINVRARGDTGTGAELTFFGDTAKEFSARVLGSLCKTFCPDCRRPVALQFTPPARR